MEESCWLFAGYTDKSGYGRAGGQMAHRVMLEQYEPLVKGLEVDHLCRVRSCINPEHLEQVTHKENVLRGDTIVAKNKVKTHCSNRHEFTKDNTRYIKLPYGVRRMCNTCNRENAARNYAKFGKVYK